MRLVLALTIALAMALAGVAATGCSDADSGSDSGDSGSEITVEQDGLEVGEEAPDFRLKNQDQATVVLSDFRGVSNVILVFYPLAFTPV